MAHSARHSRPFVGEPLRARGHSSLWRRVAEPALQVGLDRHRAQRIDEDHARIREVGTLDITVRNRMEPRERLEGQVDEERA